VIAAEWRLRGSLGRSYGVSDMARSLGWTPGPGADRERIAARLHAAPGDEGFSCCPTTGPV
jgi:hypothetical protein